MLPDYAITGIPAQKTHRFPWVIEVIAILLCILVFLNPSQYTFLNPPPRSFTTCAVYIPMLKAALCVDCLCMQVKSNEEVQGMRKAGKLAREVWLYLPRSFYWLGGHVLTHRVV